MNNQATSNIAEKDVGYAELPLDGLANGCFIARLTDGNGHITTCKFIHKQ